MTARPSPTHFEIEDSRTANCHPTAILDRVLDPSTWPQWQPEIISTTSSRRIVTGDSVEGRARLLGFVVDGRSSAITVSDDVFEEDVIVGVRMRVRYHVEPSGEGTTVTRHLSAVLPGGFSGRILSFFLKRRLQRMQQGVLESLVAQAESA